MNDIWKQSDRATCPRCGSTEYKQIGRPETTIRVIFAFSVLSGVVLFLSMFVPFAMFLFIFVVIAGISMLIKPPKQRTCKVCKKTWQYYRDPDEVKTLPGQ